MSLSAIRALALATALVAGPAMAQQYTTFKDATAELPVHPGAQLFKIIPGVGPTPGSIVQMVDPAEECSRDARKVADGLMAAPDALRICNDAITSGILDENKLGGAYVNRGVLLMGMQRGDEAMKDLNRAVVLDEGLAEAYVNRGVILIAEQKPREALAELERGLALGPRDLERAYYNRGLAREDLGDVRGAYADYRMAADLKPGWEPPLKELTRFRVANR